MGKEILFTEQQIEQLKEKGLIIESINNAKEILKHFSSFDVIEVYEKLFMKDGRFKENSTIEKIFQFYHYDRSIQNILFKYTVYIERVFKNKMASVISENLGVRKEEYLNIKNYILRNDSEEIIRNVIEEINELSGDENPYILFKKVTFSKMTSLYDFLSEEIKEKIIPFNFLQTEKMEAKELFRNSLILIRKFRNEIAHSMNFVNYKSKRYVVFRYLKKVLNEHGYLKLTNKNDYSKYGRGSNDIFSMILVIILLLDNEFLRIEILKELAFFIKNEDRERFNDFAKITNLPENFLERINRVIDKKQKNN